MQGGRCGCLAGASRSTGKTGFREMPGSRRPRMQSSTGIDVDHHAQPCAFVPVRMSTVPNLALPPMKKRPSDMQPPKHVWLTLDDGPDPVHSERILRVLDHHGIKAVFFVIGNRVAAHAATLRRTFEAGHLVANHTLTHRRLTELSDAEVLREIARGGSDRPSELVTTGLSAWRGNSVIVRCCGMSTRTIGIHGTSRRHGSIARCVK